MSKIITARNVNEAFAKGVSFLLEEGIEESSRNGKVLVAPGLVVTEYEKPCERVLFSPLRDANPFFHLFEGLWMLAGREDTAFPAAFVPRMLEYSDDGVTSWGAYGMRWRKWFDCDQIALIVDELQKNSDSRRAVLSMYDAFCDSERLSDNRKGLATAKDIPCNTQSYFDLRGGVLNMTILCRSNDMIWGGYGANAVHFSMLQEYVAAWLRAPVGVMRQVSNNFHVYLDKYDRRALEGMYLDAASTNYYIHHTQPFPLMEVRPRFWDAHLNLLLKHALTDRTPNNPDLSADPFLNFVAEPLAAAWRAWKERNADAAFEALEKCVAIDWRIACGNWLARRFDAISHKKEV